LDLVEEQLRIAAGEPLRYSQAQIQARGHAIELRLYAEDPAHGYTPTIGPILALHPPHGENVRWDSGIVRGSEVTSAFDPMLAKLIVRGSDRLDAIHRADQALRETVLLGCKTNIAFLRRLIAHPAFLAGDVHTGFLEENRQIAAEAATPVSKLQALLAAAALSTRPLVEGADAVPKLHAAIGSWRN
jgi:acetyl/propionyl-CoA carboxylase alpha subunit